MTQGKLLGENPCRIQKQVTYSQHIVVEGEYFHSKRETPEIRKGPKQEEKATKLKSYSSISGI